MTEKAWPDWCCNKILPANIYFKYFFLVGVWWELLPWMSRPSVTLSPLLSCQYVWRAIAMRQKVENLHFSWPGRCWPLCLCWWCDHWPAPGHRGLQHLTLHCCKLISTRQTLFRSINTEFWSFMTWGYTQVSHLFMHKASSWSCYECLNGHLKYRREVSAWVSTVHWPWLGQTVNGSAALLPHGPRPKPRTCPNNKDGNMEEVSSNQIPATEHIMDVA